MIDDPYRTLQVAPNADVDAIRGAYRRLARLNHPDLNASPEAAARMRAINAAYRLLSDPSRRAAYDAQRYYAARPTVPWRAGVGYSSAAGHAGVGSGAAPPPPFRRQPVVVVPAQPPTALQRRVDRIVAVAGVLLLLAIGFYTVNVIPYAERQFRTDRSALDDRQLRSPAQAAAVATAQVAADQASQEHPRSRALPERLRGDTGLRSFPGTVLIAPTTLEPFASLPLARLEATGLGIARYAVYYGDLSTGGASISGLVGRAAFEQAAPRLTECAPQATYCVGPAMGQTTGAPGLELFRPSDLIGSHAAFATHRVCCNGVFWTLSWYESRANMSYTIDLSRSVAAPFGSLAIDGDLTAARTVAALAPQLVRLP